MLYLSEDQRIVCETLGKFLSDRAPFDPHARRAAMAEDLALWRALGSELGLLGLAFPAALGGQDGDARDHLMVMNALGERVIATPYPSTIVAAGGILKRAGTTAARALVAPLIAGEAIVTLAHAERDTRYSDTVAATATATADGFTVKASKVLISGGGIATHFLVTAMLAADEMPPQRAIFLVSADAPGITSQTYRTLDRRSMCDARFEVSLPVAALIAVGAEADALLALAFDEAAAALCAEAAGIMHTLLSDTTAYLRQREQFGHPLIEFQVLRHQLAEMAMSLETCTAMAFAAAEALLEVDAKRRSAVISAAKVHIGDRLRTAAQDAVQMHGGMGMTDELIIGHCFRRALAIRDEMGSVAFHLDRYMAAAPEGLI